MGYLPVRCRLFLGLISACCLTGVTHRSDHSPSHFLFGDFYSSIFVWLEWSIIAGLPEFGAVIVQKRRLGDIYERRREVLLVDLFWRYILSFWIPSRLLLCASVEVTVDFMQISSILLLKTNIKKIDYIVVNTKWLGTSIIGFILYFYIPIKFVAGCTLNPPLKSL